MKEVKLPSGAVLKIGNTPFATSKALYQAILKEAKGVAVSSKTELSSLYKDLFCIGFSSPEIEACLWECFKRCTYNAGNGDFRIDESTFEPVAARQDYVAVCVEVAKESVYPFGKDLFAKWSTILATTENAPK